MWLNLLEVALLGGVISLDRVFLQVMISRPIVAGPIIGVLLSEPLTGLIIGAFIELLWIDRLPMGGYITPNDSIAAVLATAGAILAGRELDSVSRELMTLAILLFLPSAILARQVDIWIAKTNARLSRKAAEYARRGDMQGIAKEHRYGFLKTFAGSFTVMLLCLIPGVAFLEWVFPLLSEKMLRALVYTYSVIPLVGVAVALSTIKLRGAVPLFAGIFLITAMLMKIL